MAKSFEEIARENIAKVRDSAMVNGIFATLRIIKNFLDQKDKTDKEILNDIRNYVENSLNNATLNKKK